jgi:tetratricopeptide (TPR) repeat protein
MMALEAARETDGRSRSGTPAELDPEKNAKPPYTGQLAEVMRLLAGPYCREAGSCGRGRPKEALALALRWHEAEPGDVLALVGLGEAYEELGQKHEAARAYGSIIDLFPSRADLRRFAGARLLRLVGHDGRPDGAFELALDTFREAAVQRPDHPAGPRFLAYALARAGRYEDAFKAIVAAARRTYPSGRFAGIERILREDVAILAAAWIRGEPARRAEVEGHLARLGVALPTRPSLRFVLTWETDANDVDFHIHDASGGHAYYQRRALRSGGELYADVTTGYGPECFTIEGLPHAYPYRLSAHYYARGPMGYGMGNLEVMEHDGKGGLRFDERPFVVMTDQAFVKLGTVTGPLR